MRIIALLAALVVLSSCGPLASLHARRERLFADCMGNGGDAYSCKEAAFAIHPDPVKRK